MNPTIHGTKFNQRLPPFSNPIFLPHPCCLSAMLFQHNDQVFRCMQCAQRNMRASVGLCNNLSQLQPLKTATNPCCVSIMQCCWPFKQIPSLRVWLLVWYAANNKAADSLCCLQYAVRGNWKHGRPPGQPSYFDVKTIYDTAIAVLASLVSASESQQKRRLF